MSEKCRYSIHFKLDPSKEKITASITDLETKEQAIQYMNDWIKACVQNHNQSPENQQDDARWFESLMLPEDLNNKTMPTAKIFKIRSRKIITCIEAYIAQSIRYTPNMSLPRLESIVK